MKPIIDISFWQAPLAIDYDKLADQVDGVILRAAYGTSKDIHFDQHHAELSARGVPLGAYHYLIGSQSMSRQAVAFATILDGKDLKLGTWMDVEDTRSGTRLYRNQVLEYAALVPDSGIYTSRSRWHEIMGGAYLTDRKLWVAHYTTASQPLMPVGFDSYWLWQYSSTGRLDGYAGNLDMNRFGGSEQEWLAWIGGEVPADPDKLFDAKVVTVPPNRLRTRYTPAGLVRPEADWLQSQAIVPVYETHSTGWWRVAPEAWSSTQWLARVGEEPPAPPQPPMVGDYAYYGAVYSQRDIRWASHPLGTKSTIGANGCLMTCASMVANYFGHASNPLQLNNWLTDNGGYLDGNLFLWASIERLYPDMHFDGFVYNPTTAQIRTAISGGTLPMMYVDFDDTTPLIEMHWVLGIGLTDNDIIIADPWTGTIGLLSEMYAKAVIRYGSYRKIN